MRCYEDAMRARGARAPFDVRRERGKLSYLSAMLVWVLQGNVIIPAREC